MKNSLKYDNYADEDKPINPPYVKDPDKKDKKYYIERAESVWATFLRGLSGISLSEYEIIRKMRLYGNGEQSEELYKEYLTDEEATDTPGQASTANDIDGPGGWSQQGPTKRRKGYMNVLWDVISPASKITSTIIGNMDRVDYQIRAVTNDEQSGALQETEKLRTWAIAQEIEFLRKFAKKGNVPFQEPKFQPKSMEELNLYEAKGGFKSAYAKAMESICFHAYHASNWDEIKTDLTKDMVHFGLIATKDYYCDVSHTIKARYVDPGRAVVQYSEFRDYHDADFAGEHYYVSVGELVEAGFTRKEAEEMALQNAGFYGNPQAENFNSYRDETEYGTFGYDFFKVLILDFEFIDIDGEKEMVKKTKMGKKRVIPMKYSDDDVDDQNAKSRTKETRFKYGCKWVVGTKHVYDHGRVYDQTRPSKNEVSLSFHFQRLPTKSITQQIYPLYDNFMILWLKYQNSIANAIPAGYVIDYDAISSLKLGGEKNSEVQILKRFLETGRLIVKAKNTFMSKQGRATLPVTELAGGVGKIFDDILAGFKFNIDMVEQLTGLNPLTLGSTPSPDAPVKTSEMSVQASNNVLAPIASAIFKVKERSAKNIALWSQIRIRVGDVQGYSRFLSKTDIEAMRIASRKAVEYDIFMEAQPSLETKREILEAAKISLHNGRNGQAGINIDQFFAIMNIIENGGSLELAEIILENSIRQAENRMKESEMQTAQNAQKNEIEKKNRELQAKLAEIKTKGKQERLTEITKIALEVFIKNPDQQQRDIELRELDSLIQRIDTEIAQSQEAQKQPVNA